MEEHRTPTDLGVRDLGVDVAGKLLQVGQSSFEPTLFNQFFMNIGDPRFNDELVSFELIGLILLELPQEGGGE